jgi:hypothetical protein
MIIDILEVILTDANCNYYRKPFGLTESDLAVICVTWLWYMISRMPRSSATNHAQVCIGLTNLVTFSVLMPGSTGPETSMLTAEILPPLFDHIKCQCARR